MKGKTIGELLKAARLRKELTADHVAACCNVGRARYYQWEASDYILPKNFAALSAALDLPVTRLRNANRAKRRFGTLPQ